MLYTLMNSKFVSAAYNFSFELPSHRSNWPFVFPFGQPTSVYLSGTSNSSPLLVLPECSLPRCTTLSSLLKPEIQWPSSGLPSPSSLSSNSPSSSIQIADRISCTFTCLQLHTYHPGSGHYRLLPNIPHSFLFFIHCLDFIFSNYVCCNK